MTNYQIYTLVISCISLTISILTIIVPLIIKLIKRAKLNYYPNGKIRLLFNTNGNVIRIDGAFEALNKAISVKKVSVSLINQATNAQINLPWATVVSPITQSLIGTFDAQTTEMAHPFRISENNMSCCFIIFSDSYNTLYKNLSLSLNSLITKARELHLFEIDYNTAYPKYVSSDEYQELKQIIESHFFWKIGKYDLIINVDCVKKSKKFKYTFEINKEDYSILSKNIDEILCVYLKNEYQIQQNNATYCEVELR